MPKKEIENADIVKAINKLENKIDGLDSKVDDVLEVVNSSFTEFEGKMNKKFQATDERLENIELKLTNVAYSIDMIEVKKRLGIVEKKLKIKSPLVM